MQLGRCGVPIKRRFCFVLSKLSTTFNNRTIIDPKSIYWLKLATFVPVRELLSKYCHIVWHAKRESRECHKNVNYFGLDKDILHQIIWDDAPLQCGDDHLTESRNQKLIRVTSSNKRLEHKCVDGSDYLRYLNQILYIELKHHTINMTECSKCTRLWTSAAVL